MEYDELVLEDIVEDLDGRYWLIVTKKGPEYSYASDGYRRRSPHRLQIYAYDPEAREVCSPPLMEHKSIAHLSSEDREERNRPTIIHNGKCQALKRFFRKP